MKPSKNEKGYLHINLTKNGKPKCMRVHRLVAQVFIPNPENKPQVNHIDFNRENNCVNNLEWVTAQENTQYSVCNRKLPGQQKKRNNKTGERNITHYNGYYVVRIYGKKYVSKSFKNIDDAKQWRDLKLKEIYD